MKSIIYIADIDQDIDDIIAAEYLQRQGCLKAVVVDPYIKNKISFERINMMKDMGITVENKITNCDAIFIGGAFTSTARYLLTHKVDCIVANGGYVGSNIVDEKHQLSKFKGKTECPTYNFNLDPNSAMKVLQSKNVNRIYLVGKNVCHSERNTILGIWKNKDWLKKYNLRDNKRLHDLLMVKEGLILLDYRDSDLLEYDLAEPYNTGINGKYTKWGSRRSAGNNDVVAAIHWR